MAAIEHKLHDALVLQDGTEVLANEVAAELLDVDDEALLLRGDLEKCEIAAFTIHRKDRGSFQGLLRFAQRLRGVDQGHRALSSETRTG